MTTRKPIPEMSDVELVRLIHAASGELARRANIRPAESLVAAASVPVRDATFDAGITASVAAASAPVRDAKMAALLSEPDADDADYCLMIAARIRAGGYVKASERARVAQIAEAYPLWVSRQGLPKGHSAGDWKRATGYASAARAVKK